MTSDEHRLSELERENAQLRAELRAQAARLGQRDAEWRLVTEQMRDTVWLLDLSLRCVWASPSVERARGYTAAEIAAMPLEEHLTPASLARVLALAAEFLSPDKLADPTAEVVIHQEFEFVRRDGSSYWDDTVATLMRDADGRPTGLLCVGRDVSERHAAAHRLAESEQRYQLLADNSRDIVWTADLDGRYTYISPAVSGCLGYTPEELLARSVGNQLVPGQRLDLLSLLNAAATRPPSRHASTQTVEHQATAKDGRLVELESVVALVFATDGRPLGLQGATRVITERKQAAQAHSALQSQLQQAQKMESVGRLAGGVAHDFNNMLGVIIGHTEMALERLGPADPLRADLETVLSAAQRSADLTRQLLTFARKQEIAPRVLDLNQVVGSMLKLLPRLLGEDISLGWQPQPDLWPVSLDPTQMDQILANLCVNARDAVAAAGRSGRIRLETTNYRVAPEGPEAQGGALPGDYVRLAVTDNGCGMDATTLAQVFEPFFTTKAVGRGTGLGLSTVYGAVRQNGGFVTVESTPGSGTTFGILLPRHHGEGEQAAPVASPTTARAEQRTILLVEDEPAILRMTRTLLERQGYGVLAAGSPAQALELAALPETPIDLLITDVVMPDMNGHELAQRLLDRRPGLACLFMSGYAADVIAQHGVRAEGTHFLQKPYYTAELLAKVAEVLGDDRSA